MAMTLADLLSMQQDNSDPGVHYSTGQPTLSSLTRGRTEEEINQLLSGMQIRSPGFNPNFMSGEPYMPPQQMPQNYVQRGNNAPINMDQRQPMPQNYIQRGNNAPIDLGQSRRQHDVFADGPELLSRQQQSDGTFLVTKRVPARDGEGRMSSAVRQYIETPDYLNPAKLKEMQFKQAMQKLSEGNVDEQLKRAQLAELMGMDPAQMGGMVAAPVPIQTPGFFPDNGAQPSGAQRQVAELSQKILERRYGKPEPGQRWDNQGKSIPIPGYEKPLGETQKKQVTGVQNLSAAIDEYQKELGKWSALDIVSPDKRAAMGVKYNNMMLQAKEAYNLGVLNGPDYEILTSVVTNPASMTGAITSNKAMSNQAAELKRMMQKIGENASISDPRVRPGQSATPAPPAAVAKLKSDPSLAAAFDAKYGAGSAAKALGR